MLAMLYAAIEAYGPDRVAAITYTRSAAAELQARVAAHYGRDVRLPYVNTIHSIAHALLGRPPLVDGRGGRFAEFAASLRLVPSPQLPSPLEDSAPLWWAEVESSGELARFRTQLSRQRHLLTPDAGTERFRYLADAYQRWKRREGLCDFEDLLEQGMRHALPVRALLCDEAQDNSALMWQVTEAWAEGCALSAWAADPHQALYAWIGADPELFVQRVRAGAGQLLPLGDSHRLTARAAAYAQQVLRRTGHAESAGVLGAWAGVGDGADDGSVLYLARTRRLLTPIIAMLEGRGEPWADLHGNSPLTTPAGRGFRVLTQLLEGDLVRREEVVDVVARAGGHLRRPLLPELVDAQQAAQHLNMPLDVLRGRLPHAAYLYSVYRTSGLAGLVSPPTTQVSTIHGAKGREAATVYLLPSWGRLPAGALGYGARRAEGCVAYVAVTRHRHRLALHEAGTGRRYPHF
jgi:superfamily I DNA/RNA helicase